MIKFGIIGLGLIGGSIFKDLTKLGYNCIGISRSQIGIANVYHDYSYLKDRDIVFVCKEMSKTPKVLEEIEPYLSSKTIVTDVCSLKEFVTKRRYAYKFIPSHPMAGTELCGWANSKEGLFSGAKWVLTPLEKDYTRTILEDIIEQLGAEVVYASPKEHDEAAALISHMPLVVAQALYQAARGNKLALKLASSGFRDMTRLALSSIDMADDMVQMNAKNIEISLLRLYACAGQLLKGGYKESAESIKTSRSKMYRDGKNVL